MATRASMEGKARQSPRGTVEIEVPASSRLAIVLVLAQANGRGILKKRVGQASSALSLGRRRLR